MSRFLVVAGLCYVAVIAALVVGLMVARNAAHRSFSTSAAQQAWDEWRKSTESADGADNLPVQRSIPKSIEPPTLVLLRDYFAVCAAAAICITTALYWTVAILLRGVLYGPSFPVEYKHDPHAQIPMPKSHHRQ